MGTKQISHATLRKNIQKLSLIKTFRWFMLIMPILVLFFQENGLSMKAVFILQSVFSISIVVFEVPTGYFGDRVGRRISIITGSAVSAMGFVVYSFSYGFTGFLIAELLLGIGVSFISGSDSALLYDTLLQLGQAGRYKQMEGRLSSIGNFSEGTASILGGLLATISLRLPFYIETLLLLIALFIAFSLVEPDGKSQIPEHTSRKKMLHIVKFALYEQAQVKWLIIYSSLVGASTLTLVWFIQPYFTLVGLPLALFGVVWAMLQFSVGLFALSAHRVEAWLGRRNSLISLIVLSMIGYGLLSVFQYRWAILFILIFYFVRGIHGPVLKDYVNRLISSDIRASVLSVKNLMGRLVFAGIGPFAGWISDHNSLPVALAVCGAFFGLSGSFTLLALHRCRALE